MRRTWCLLALLASTPWLVVSASTDVQAAPPEQRRGIATPQELTAQSIPAPSQLSIKQSVVPQPPPLPQQETIPLAPLPSSAWVPGYWSWNNGWQWVAGHWAQPPPGTTTWVPGQWTPQGQNWVWLPGRWQ
jgi:hypothetical protein